MSALPLAVSTLLEAALQLGPLALVALLYARRVRTLRASGHAPARWRRGCFYAGLATILVALTSLGVPSQELLYAHMIEHLLLGDVGALLIVLGLTGPLLAPVLRIGLFDRLRLLAARESEQREELLDYARAHGLELSETRAARAVAAGRGAELRRRLETNVRGAGQG